MFVRGDCDGDTVVSGIVTDAVFLLNFNFLGRGVPGCLAACDANGDGDVRGSVNDAVYLLNFNFKGGVVARGTVSRLRSGSGCGHGPGLREPTEIAALADPEDRNEDGISGRVNIISTEGGAVGRFGYKCQTASIEAFNRGALNNQMGITSTATSLLGDAGEGRESVWRSFHGSVAHAQVADPTLRIEDFDDVPDPEISHTDLTDLIFFQENLAAPRRGRITAAVRRGEKLFTSIGCIDCHESNLETERGLIHPYSDLLLHDMGPELADGVVMEEASGSEFRTQPLWGLRHHPPFLHDGRADTIDAAIRLHGGEAQAARDRYDALATQARCDLLIFLESL